MGKRLRLAVATVLVGVPAGTGLSMAPGFAAESSTAVRQDVGGCWTYVPAVDAETPPEQRWTLPVLADVSTAATPWSALGEDGKPVGALLDLTTDGATTEKGERGFRLSVDDGPILAAGDRLGDAPLSGVATAVLSIVPVGEDAPADAEVSVVTAETPFVVGAGQAVDDLVFTGSFPLVAGSFRLDVEQILFDERDTTGYMTACNGQAIQEPTIGVGGEATGVNPATQPLGTSVSTTFTALAGVTFAVDSVHGQVAGDTTAARAGDVLELRVAGLASDSEFRLQLRGATTVPLVDNEGAEVFNVDEAGSAALAIEVPVGAPTQAVGLQVVQNFPEGDRVVNEIPITVLGSPIVTATEKVTDDSLEIVVAGSDWDPGATVRVQPMAGDAASTDSAAEAVVGVSGIVSVDLVVSDADATGLLVTQERPEGFEALGVTHTLLNAVPIVPGDPAPTDPPAPTQTPQPTTPPATQPAPPVSSAPPVAAPPVTVPLPGDLPVEKVDGPVVAEPGEEILTVSEASLVGETTMSELFGGSSRRDVRILVENAGETLVSNPLVRLGVGRDADVVPGLVAAEVGDLQPGARVMVSVDVALPMASFGTYQVVGQVGEAEATRFQLRWDTYPWGLIGLNLAGVALLAWGVARRRNAIAPTPLAGAEGDEEGASVVDLHALDEWWVRGRVARAAVPTTAAEGDDNDSVVDLEAADRWFAKRSSKVS